MRKDKEIKVKVVYEEGYEQRFTDCCLAILRRKRDVDLHCVPPVVGSRSGEIMVQEGREKQQCVS